MKEIIFLFAIRLSGSININVGHLIKLCLLKRFSGNKCDMPRINLHDLTGDSPHLKKYVFSKPLFV